MEGQYYGTVSFSVYRLSTCHMSSPGHCLSTQSYPSAKRAKSHFKNIISTLYTVGGNVNLCSHYGKQYEGFPKKLKNRITVEPSSSIPGYISKKKKKKKKTTPDFKSRSSISRTYNCFYRLRMGNQENHALLTGLDLSLKSQWGLLILPPGTAL